jgi:tetratricopeptide (TPR) repeat protein
MGTFKSLLMNPEPFSFQYPIADFDLTKLPVDPALLRENPAMLVSAVQTFYQESFRKLGGVANIVVKDGVVSVSWLPKAGDAAEQVMEHALSLLRQGDYKTAEPFLRALIARDADHADALFNLGMMLSDQRKLTEAAALITRFLSLVPDSSKGWTALGVAHFRNGEIEAAKEALSQALEIDPQDAYALRNLGALLVKESPEAALPILAQAARLMPQDQAAQYGHAQCLLHLGRTDEADPIFVKAIELSPLSDIAELARTARTSIAHESMRSSVGGGARPDAVMYCLDALQKFRDLGKTKTGAIVFEIAMLGRSGLDINDPAKKYSLRSLPGSFSGLHLVSLMYTGMKLVDPSVDAGIDLSKEYAAAKGLLEQESSE